ncbi:MAG: Methionine aminopeptidase [Parcubacteria group bacterium GW2011_GWC1_41_7]|nr:MAG: Methionine aminopeptidase [Parcubacteria group bacterium GW2011_GWC1_41_7]
MCEGGEKITHIFSVLKKEVYAGKKGSELDALAESLIKEAGGKPAFKNYKPTFADTPYRYTLCLSVNNQIVHGYPTDAVILQKGDVVSLDLGMKYQGYYLDCALTVGIDPVSPANKNLIESTRQALKKAISVATPGHTFGDVGHAIQEELKTNNLVPVKNLCGHDIGTFLHGDLQILNFGKPGTGEPIQPYTFFTIEPMASFSSPMGVIEDEYVFITGDDRSSAHFEVTLMTTEKGNIVLTPILDL